MYNNSDIVTRICRASGMEGGTPLFHMIPPKPDVSRYSRPKVTSLLPLPSSVHQLCTEYACPSLEHPARLATLIYLDFM